FRAEDGIRDFHVTGVQTCALPILELRSRARRLKQEHGLDMLLIDYLQLMSAGARGQGENRQQEISTISRGLKALARELDIPVLEIGRASCRESGARPVGA